MTTLKTFPEDAGGTWWIGLSQEEHQAASNRIRAARLAAGEEDLGDDYYDRSRPKLDNETVKEREQVAVIFASLGIDIDNPTPEDIELTYPKLK